MRLGWIAALVIALRALPAHAVPCTNDTDCPTAACGGQVCNWAGVTHTCGDPAGGGNEGWCNTLDNTTCKCHGEGATCVSTGTGPHCTFTKTSEIPDLKGADLTPPPDLKPLPPDLFGVDLTPPPDMVTPPDLFGADLAGLDLSTPPAADMTSAPDLSATAPGDMGSSDMASEIQCDHDTECPDTACGGQVCRWHLNSQLCVAAGTDPQSEDGWCNKDDECKCHGQGATCNKTTFHCTFTTPAGKPKAKGCAVGGDAAASLAFALFAVAALLVSRRFAYAPRKK